MSLTCRSVFLIAVFTFGLSGCGTFRNDQASQVQAADRAVVIGSATGATAGRPSRFVPAETQGTPANASADPACAVRAVQLLAEGKATQLANSFSGRPTVVSQLNELAARTGALSAIEQTAAPRFKSHHRLTVGQAVSPYTGAWVNATSALLGDVQFHVAMSPAAPCALFALHLDTAKP
jgi:hypothetical protein